MNAPAKDFGQYRSEHLQNIRFERSPEPGMSEVVLKLRLVPGASFIRQDPAMLSSQVSLLRFAESLPGAVLVRAVEINGRPHPFRRVDPFTFRVSPMLALECQWMTVRLIADFEPPEPPRARQATYPLPSDEYGFQRPESTAGRGFR